MYQIGVFSKICHVSVKTLRHYDKIGLLKPVKVDRFTGYRYYDQTQLERMLLIQRLKRYGFSLEEARTLLDCNSRSTVHAKLLEQKQILERAQMETELILQELSAHLRSLERTGDLMAYQKGYEIRLTETPERPVLSCRENMGVDEFFKYYGPLYERLARESLTPDGVTGAMYHDEEFHRESSDITLFVGIRERDRADQVLEACLCAATVHKGAYSALSDAYGALMAWIQENGYEWTGAPYEIYAKTARDALPPSEWETEIYFPVKKAG